MYPVLSEKLVAAADAFAQQLKDNAASLDQNVSRYVLETLTKNHPSVSAAASSSISLSPSSSSSSSSSSPHVPVGDISLDEFVGRFPSGFPFFVTPHLVKESLADFISLYSHEVRAVVQQRFEEEMRDLLLSANNSDSHHFYLIGDYSTRLLSLEYREKKGAFFGKRGNSLHICTCFFKACKGCPNCPQNVDGIVKEDVLIFFDDSQDEGGYDSLGCVFLTFKHLRGRHPHLKVSHNAFDNGTGYHTNLFVIGMSFSSLLTDIRVEEILFWEQGTGKSYPDRVAARVRHWILAAVNSGFSAINGWEAMAALRHFIEQFDQVAMCGRVVPDLFSLDKKSFRIKDISRYSRIRYDHDGDGGITVWEQNGPPLFVCVFAYACLCSFLKQGLVLAKFFTQCSLVSQK
jgi:hypothetical protein